MSHHVNAWFFGIVFRFPSIYVDWHIQGMYLANATQFGNPTRKRNMDFGHEKSFERGKDQTNEFIEKIDQIDAFQF